MTGNTKLQVTQVTSLLWEQFLMQMCQLLPRICPKGNLLPILYKSQPYKADSGLKNTLQNYEKLCLYQDYISFVKKSKVNYNVELQDMQASS